MFLQLVRIEEFLYIFQTKQISLKTSSWMVSYEVFKISAIFGVAKTTSNIYIFF